MEPIPFRGHNATFAKNQPEYQTLPAYRCPDGVVITCWSLSGEELMKILQTGRIWLSQSTFGTPLQHVLPSLGIPDCIKRVL